MANPTRAAHCISPNCKTQREPGLMLCWAHGIKTWQSVSKLINEKLDRDKDDRLVTRKQIRFMYPGIKADTLRTWTQRDKVKPAQQTPDGEDLFWANDIKAAILDHEDAKADGHNSVVYYLKQHNGLIKIGYTIRLKQRLSSMRYRVSDVLAVEPGGRAQETARHRQFKDIRVGHREDFHPTPELLAHIAATKQRYPTVASAIMSRNASGV